MHSEYVIDDGTVQINNLINDYLSTQNIHFIRLYQKFIGYPKGSKQRQYLISIYCEVIIMRMLYMTEHFSQFNQINLNALILERYPKNKILQWIILAIIKGCMSVPFRYPIDLKNLLICINLASIYLGVNTDDK